MWQNPFWAVSAYSLKKSNNPLHIYSPYLWEVNVPLGNGINVQSTKVYGGMGVQLHSLNLGARFGEWLASLLYRFALIACCIEAWVDSGADLEIFGHGVNISPSQGKKTRILGGQSNRSCSRHTVNPTGLTVAVLSIQQGLQSPYCPSNRAYSRCTVHPTGLTAAVLSIQ
jgi:hypothetical protein